jgi:hypothetical protein
MAAQVKESCTDFCDWSLARNPIVLIEKAIDQPPPRWTGRSIVLMRNL